MFWAFYFWACFHLFSEFWKADQEFDLNFLLRCLCFGVWFRFCSFGVFGLGVGVFF